MVAAIDIAIMLNSKSTTASLAKRADRRLHADHQRERSIKELNIASADIIFDPNIEYIAHKLTEALCTYRPRRNICPLTLWGLHSTITKQFGNGQKLHKNTYLTQVIVDLCTTTLAVDIYRRQCIILHTIAIEALYTFHYAREGGITSRIYAMGIMYTLRTIYRHTNKEVIIAENLTPLIINEQPIGLY